MIRSRRRQAYAVAFAAGIALPLSLGAAPANADPGIENMTASEAVAAKADADLVASLASGAEAEFWINLDTQANLNAIDALSKEAKGTAVFQAKTQHAKETQADLIALLEEQGVDYRSYWIVNTIHVTGDADLLADVALRTEVESLTPSVTIDFDEPVESTEATLDEEVAWGVANINSPEAWADFGAFGDDIVVANIDTGVEFDHPALVNSYRGNNGDGTFTHDYNWFDPDGLCSTDEPCDDHDHGTHTMGTMVGKEGDYTVGVAPGATWIAAKGCSATAGCPDTALLGSAQWILAPTDVAGNNPDPTKAPDVVNNSWGSTSDDPWFEEIVQSWTDAGIFSSWSNGNNGPSCSTSGSPGIYQHSYSSGAYDENNVIASFSSRGPGRDGQVKPNIAAPGVAVISADAGGTYRSMSGTSMAAPHTAGVVAQIWSVAPTLRGDVAGTWEVLNTTARDTAADQCGGTPENNNVFGEGRLDAYAAVAASPTGDTGSLEGTVVSGDTALSGVVLTASSADRTRETSTNDDGAYRYGALVAGEYDVTASKFGYISETVSVSVVAGETAVADFDLDPAPAGSVTGTVADGSGHGWPLYSKITVDGTDRVTFSDPVTGDYALDLPEGSYTLTIDPVIDGYDTINVEVTTGTESNVAVPVGATCAAPGYQFDWDALSLHENFDGGTVPSGWTVESRSEAGWVFDDPDNRGNKTGGEGGFAIADDDYLGPNVPLDSDLISPVFDLTTANSPVLSFASDYYHLSSSSATVSITTDGGETWTELWTKTASERGPKTVSLDLADYATETAAQVKFTYADANAYAWYWQVDDVQIGTPDCVTVDGGLVMGHVYDANTGGPLVGAVVTDTVTGSTGTAVETPEDPNVADGYYWLFTSETGAHDFTASRTGWQAETVSVDVVADGVATQGFTLGAGRIEVDTTSISSNVTLGGSWTEEVTLTNTGSAPVTVEIGERNGEFVPLGKPTATSVQMSAPATTSMVTAAEVEAIAADAEGEWSALPNYPTAVFDATSATGDGVTYVIGGIGTSATSAAYAFDHESGEWTAIANAPDAVMQARAAVVDGKLYLFGGWAGSTTLTKTSIYDPETNTWSQGAPMPATRAGSGLAVLDGAVYLVGGCDSSTCAATNTVFRYDVAGDSWDTLANYPTVVSHGACGTSAGTVVCAGGSNGDAGLAATYAYNAGSDSWEARADLPVGLWAMAFTTANDMLVVSNGVLPGNTSLTNATYGYDAGTDTWVELAPSGTELYRGTMACGIVKATGRTINNAASNAAEKLEGFDGCDAGGADVPWLSVDTQTVTVNPGESVTIEVTMSAKPESGIDQPGTYQGAVVLNNDSPYGASTVTATMVVAPKANQGKVSVSVTAEACNGDLTALANAQVQLLAADGTRVDLASDGNGVAAHWVKQGKYTVIVSKDGWAAAVQIVTVSAGKNNKAEFVLDQLGCTATKTNGGWYLP